ncbi:unnamed protein product [Medioppia subpectinata]|uniref:Uncharacterized protein n=1 Tax=Medioppia subpectinata TaxID=1979941 RepID=A0A7R9Q865_9ACAR|nr:unnamed protein product [Medioppia subpectinata]CAG2116344.1 unnamed protein product [Medioppia subpectinata]
MNNPLCDQNIAIDSAFVDKYTDLGSDVITLFADNTVYQLTVNTTDPINPVFVYNRSQSVDEWSEGIVGPINSTIKTSAVDRNQTLYAKQIYFETLVKQPFKWIRSVLFYRKSQFHIITYDHGNGSTNWPLNHYNLIQEYQKNGNNNHTVDEIESYLSKTTAGFAFNDYFYLFAGSLVCRMNNKTIEFEDNCLTQTIAQWIGCEDNALDPTDSKYTMILILMIILVVITALIIAFITYKLWTRSAPKGYQKYKTKQKHRQTVSSDTESGNKSLNASESRDPKASMSLSSLKDKRPTDLKVKSNEESVGSVGSD